MFARDRKPKLWPLASSNLTRGNRATVQVVRLRFSTSSVACTWLVPASTCPTVKASCAVLHGVAARESGVSRIEIQASNIRRVEHRDFPATKPSVQNYKNSALLQGQ